MHRSPSDLVGSRLSAGKWGSRCNAAGWSAGETEPVLALGAEQRGTEAECDGQSCRRQTDGLTGVVRGCAVRSGGRSHLAGAEPAGHPLGGLGPVLQQLDQIGPRACGHVECGEVQPVLHRGDDAGLALPIEGVGTCARVGLTLCRGVLTGQRKTARRPGRNSGQADACSAEQPSARHGGSFGPTPLAPGRALGGAVFLTRLADRIVVNVRIAERAVRSLGRPDRTGARPTRRSRGFARLCHGYSF